MSSSTWRQGLQLAAAVLLSYGVSATLHLPEGLWAVMSALIVMRPSTGSTLGAGWERVRGTLVGCGFGLAGIGLQHRLGLGSAATTLVITALLAGSSAWRPPMRSAPVAALIVLSSTSLPDHSVLQLAMLRVAEIAIGVASGLAVSMLALASNARMHFDTACATALRQIAAQLLRDLRPDASASGGKEAAKRTLRLTLRELAILAAGADQEARLRHFLRSPRLCSLSEGTRDCTRIAQLVVRAAHDADVLVRLARNGMPAGDDPNQAALARAADRALVSTAESLEGRAAPELGLLSCFAAQALAPSGSTHAAWIGPAARLLLEDLAGLARRCPASPV